LGKTERKKTILVNFADSVSKNNKLIVEVLATPAILELLFVCDNFFDRIFKTEANAGNK